MSAKPNIARAAQLRDGGSGGQGNKVRVLGLSASSVLANALFSEGYLLL